MTDGACPLCFDAVRTSNQNYVDLRLPWNDVVVLASPYPYRPKCVTWAIGRNQPHPPQDCGPAEPKLAWLSLFRTVIDLCVGLEDHVVGFNGTVGNSPGQLHLYDASRRETPDTKVWAIPSSIRFDFTIMV
jgi:hypothetical protein